MNKILERQLNKVYGSLTNVPKELDPLLKMVSDTYDHAEEDRLLSERSLEISSRELMEKASLLSATLDATGDGIVVVDMNGKIVSYNDRLKEIWKIPDEVLRMKDDGAAKHVVDQLNNSEVFLARIKELKDQPEAESSDTLEFKDGRVIERFSRPQRMPGRGITGRVWSFRDVTERTRNEAREQERHRELERINTLMVDRELKMIELKKEIEALKARI